MARKKRSFGSILANLFLFLNILAILALFASYAALYIDPRKIWVFAFLGLSYPVILMVNLVFVLLWLITWKRYIFLSLVSILIGFPQLTTLIPIRFTSSQAPDQAGLGVMTYNVHGFSYLKKNDHPRTGIYSFFEKEKPDIVCIQEYIPSRKDLSDSGKIEPSLNGLPNGRFKSYFDSRKGMTSGLATLSKYPVLNYGYLKDGEKRVYAIFTDLRTGDGNVRVYNVHLVSFRFGNDEYTFYDRLKNQQQGEDLRFKERILKIIRKLKLAFEDRSAQTDRILEHIRTSPYPVIVCGDFNDSPFSYSYHQMSRNLKDAYRKAGSGFPGNTYAGELPSYRIDYILFDRHFKAYNYQRSSIEMSDHYPVSTRLTRSEN